MQRRNQICFQRKYFINILLGGVDAIRMASYLYGSFTRDFILLGREKLLRLLVHNLIYKNIHMYNMEEVPELGTLRSNGAEITREALKLRPQQASK